MTWYTHINRGVIDSNRKHGKNEPPVKFQKGKYGKATYCHEVRLKDARVVYDHEGTILPCGARLVLVSDEQPEVVR